MISKERAREIAANAWHAWAVECAPVGLSEYIADALHAAYEAERGSMPSDSARLASIKETARAMYAHNTEQDSLESILRYAEAFESAFERRYGGKQ